MAISSMENISHGMFKQPASRDLPCHITGRTASNTVVIHEGKGYNTDRELKEYKYATERWLRKGMKIICEPEVPPSHPDVLPDNKNTPKPQGGKRLLGHPSRTVDDFIEELMYSRLPDNEISIERVRVIKTKTKDRYRLQISLCNVTHVYPGSVLSIDHKETKEKQEEAWNVVNKCIDANNCKKFKTMGVS